MKLARLSALDGWRGISIALVLLGHLFPLGPKVLQLNVATAGEGMAIFFTLSGFLITRVLLKGDTIRSFLIHRFMRIVPLAWLAIALTLTFEQADARAWLPHLLFYVNEDNAWLTLGTQHFWSLCVEVQFYVAVALLVATSGRRALFLLPLLALVVTGLKIWTGKPMAINTEFRVDEILAGCTLALVNEHRRAWLQGIPQVVPWLLFPLLLLSAHPDGGPLNFLRPYIAATMVGSTLYLAQEARLSRVLDSRVLRYLALISYALYVVHGCLTATWLASGSTMVKYLKRPLFMAVTFGLAHLSTKYYERYFIDLGKRLAGVRPAAVSPDAH